MNIFLHELKAYRKSTVIWTISLSVLSILFLSMFPSISNQAEEFKKVLEGYPVEIRKAIGLNLENLFSILGFYSYTFLYISLCGAVQAMNLGVSIVSKETREKTADFLLTKPVTRTAILTSKLLAAVVSIVFTNIVYQIVASIMASNISTENYSKKTFLLLSLSLFLMQLIFLALGIILSVIFTKIKSVLAVSLGIVFTFFFIGTIGATTGDKVIRYFSPFKYFDTNYIIKNASYELSFTIVGLTIFIISIFCSYYIYLKKDIHAV